MKQTALALSRIFLTISLLAALSSPAATITWTNTAGGNWSAAANWSPNQVPASSDSALITTSGSYTVTLNTGATVAGLTVGGAAGTQTFTVQGGNAISLNGAATVAASGVFNLSGGTVNGSGALTINGAFNWSAGSLLNSGGVTLNGTSSLNGTTENSMALYVLLMNTGALTWSGTGSGANAENLYIPSSGTLSNLAAGTLTISADVSSDGGGTLGNAGLLTKTGGSGTTSLNETFVNSGTLDIQSGTIGLTVVSTLSGVITISNGAALNFPSGTHTVVAGFTDTGAGSNVISGATVNFDIAAGTTLPNLTLTSGTLGGTGAIMVTGPFAWSGGSINNTAGVTLNGASTLNGATENSMQLYAPLINAGTLTWTGSGTGANAENLYIPSSGTLTNLAAGTITITADVSSDGNGIFGNAGLLTKTGGSGTTSFNETFVNSGTLDIQDGAIGLPVVSTLSGIVTTADGTTLDFPSGTHTVVAGFSESGPGAIEINGGTVNFDNAAGTTLLNLTFTSGNLGGNGSLTVNGPFAWSGGSINNTAGITLDGPSTLNGATDNSMQLYGPLINAGALTWTGSGSGANAQNLYIASSMLTNLAAGTITITADVSSDGNGIFGNAGTLTKTGGTNTTSFNQNFVNSGTLDIQSGTIGLTVVSTLAGPVTTANGTTLNFPSGTHTVVAGFSDTGPGAIEMSGATVNFNNAAGTTLLNLTLTSGDLGGNGSLTVNGPFAWSGGSINNTAGVTLNGASTLSGTTENCMQVYGPLFNAGGLTWTGSGTGANAMNLYIASGTLSNLAAGTITITADVSSDGNGIFGNAGTLTKTAGTNTTSFSENFVNSGTLDIQSGTISLAAASTLAGPVTTANGTTLNFPSGTHTVVAGFSDTGPGAIEMSGATVNFNNAAGTTLLNLTLTSGDLGGNGSLTVNGPFAWSGGSINNTAGVTLNGASTLSGTTENCMQVYGPLFNAGGLTWTGSGTGANAMNLYIASGTLSNLAAGTITITADVSSDGGGTFGNAGLVTKTGASGTTAFSMPFINSGILSAQSGIISLTSTHTLVQGALNFGISGLTNFGMINLSGNATLTGTLSANLINGYVPNINDAFAVLTYGSHSGLFTGTNLPPLAVWQTTYNAANVTITLLKYVPTLTWPEPADITYGTLLGAAQLDATAASPTNLGVALPGAFTYAPPLGTALLAGSNQILTVAFIPTDLTKYTNASTNVAINVLKAPLTVTANNTNKTYGQTTVFAGTEITPTGLQFSDTMTGATLATSGSVATATVANSPYPILPSAAQPSSLTNNYIITYQNGQLTVNPAPLTITANNNAKVYGQTVTFAGTEFAANGLVNSDTVTSVSLTSAGAVATAPVAGSPYSIAPSAAVGAGLGNYTLTYANGALTVSPAPLTVTAASRSKSYGQAATFAGTEFSTSALLNSDSVTSVTLTSPGAPATATVAGSPYSITASAAVGSGLGNYTITYAPNSLTVTPAALTITANAQTKTYGASIAFGTGGTMFVANGLLNADTVASVTLSVSGNGGAGTASVANSPYAITPSAPVGSGVGNYAITYAPSTLTVNPAPLTVTASGQSKPYGQAIGFGSGSLAFTSAGLQNSETIGTVTLAVSDNGGAATALVAGSPYAITPSAATGGSFTPGNYTITYANGALTVNPAALTITANNLNKPFGQSLAFVGTEFTAGGLVNGDSVTSVTLTSAGAAASATAADSPYPIVPGAAVGTGLVNYNITYVNGSLTVSASVPVITWANPAPIVYGTALDSVQLNATASVAGAFAYNPANGSLLNTGTNTLTVIFTPADIADYSLTTNTVTIIVTPASLTVTAANTNRAYGQANPTFTGAILGLTNGDLITVTYSCAATPASPIGQYPIVASLVDPNDRQTNYTVTLANATLTVTPAPLTITADNQSKTLGQLFTFAGTEFTTAGLQNSDKVTSVTLTSPGAATSATVAGSPYNIVPSAAVGSGLANYTINYVNGLMTVTTSSQRPTISFVFTRPNLTLSWPTNAGNFQLLQITNFTSRFNWMPVTSGVTVTGDKYTFTVDTTHGSACYGLESH